MTRLILCAIVLWAFTTSAEAAFVQKKTNTVGSATTLQITFDAPPTNGNRIVCGLMANVGTSTINTPTGGGVATWTNRFTHTATGQRLYIYDGVTDGTASIVTHSYNTIASLSMICVELNGAYTFDAVGVVATGVAGPATPTDVTTVATNTALLAFGAKTAGSTTGAADTTDAAFLNITQDNANGRYVGAYAEKTSQGSFNTSWTTTATVWTAVVVSYAQPAGGGGGGSTLKAMTLLGVGGL